MTAVTALLGFYFTGDKLTGVTAVNRPAEFMAGRMLIDKAAKEDIKLDPQGWPMKPSSRKNGFHETRRHRADMRGFTDRMCRQ